MLISFTVENWKSFKNETTLSMVASSERQHRDRISLKPAGYNLNLLPIAAIYGGNASGKTNFFHAINFVKKMVVDGVKKERPIPVFPFKLSQSPSQQVSICVQLLADQKIYELSFVATRLEILEEKLVEIKKKTEKTLYQRKKNAPYFFDPLLEKEEPALRFAEKGTQDNQLFLNNTVSQNLTCFQAIYNWFDESLMLVAPDDRFDHFKNLQNDDIQGFYQKISAALMSFDTGISRIGFEDFSEEELPSFIRENMEENLTEGEQAGIKINNASLIATMRNGDIILKKLMSFHQAKDTTEKPFDLEGEESDGSKRLLDLLPVFLGFFDKKIPKVVIIDELDRSLHTLLTRTLLDSYLNNCSSESRNQLIMTTHDVLLMDQDLLRRDEMWVSERNQEGSSVLYSFAEFKEMRYDKDVRKTYLSGRLGGVPRFFLDSNWIKENGMN